MGISGSRRVKDDNYGSSPKQYFYDLSLDLVNPNTDDRQEPYERLDLEHFTDQKESEGYYSEDECYDAAIERAKEYYEEGVEFFSDDPDIDVEGVSVLIRETDGEGNFTDYEYGFDLFKNGAGEWMTY